MRSLEHLHAVTLMQRWAYIANKNGLDHRLLFSIPNQGRGGGIKAMRRGVYMKYEGLRAGIPDYFLAVARGGYNGLFIELKSPKGKTSTEQKEMLTLLDGQKYAVDVCYGWEQASAVIEYYLSRGDVARHEREKSKCVPPV